MTDDVKNRESFKALKAKYQAGDYQDCSPSSPLYFMLRKADLGMKLSPFELDWLITHGLSETSKLIFLNPQERQNRLEVPNREKEVQQILVELSPLMSKYQVPTDYQPVLDDIYDPLCFLLWRLESEEPLTIHEIQWLEAHRFIETTAIAKEISRKMSRFLRLKDKYQATQHPDSSSSSPLYPILERLDEDRQLTDEELNWLKSQELFDTLEIYHNKGAVWETEFFKLKEKYHAIKHSKNSSVVSQLYQILQKFDAGQPIKESELEWLKEQKLTETFFIIREVEQTRHFAELKRLYGADQYEESSPSSNLYQVLKKIDAGELLKKSDMSFLSRCNLTETIVFAADKYAESLNAKVKSESQLLSPKEIDWLKQNGREEIMIFAQQKHFAFLKSRYGVSDYENKSPSDPLYGILQKFFYVNRLPATEVAWLKEKLLFDPGSPLFIAYHKNEARLYELEYQKTGDKWNIVHAVSHWRSADKPRKAVNLTGKLKFDKMKGVQLKSVLLAARGEALRDIGKLDEAETCARQALKLQPNNHLSYTLMGTISFEREEYSEGQQWFDRAKKHGASPKNIDTEIEEVLKKAHKDKCQKMVDCLLKKNPKRYKWANKYILNTAIN